MAAPVTLGTARTGEEEYRTAFRDAVIPHLGTTPERAEWCGAAIESLWEYGERSPLLTAMAAWRRGDAELCERALADDARLHALAEAAR